MMKYQVYLFSFFFLFSACKAEEKKQEIRVHSSGPVISSDGRSITFPDRESISFFKTDSLRKEKVVAELTAPAVIAANVLPSGSGASQNIVLFSAPDLAGDYTQLIQTQINLQEIEDIVIKQKELELERTKELQSFGSATGQELLNAETELLMARTSLELEKASMIEYEIRLQSGGFNPEELQKASAGTAYLICDIPENQINKIKTGQSCKAIFSAYPDQPVAGHVDAVTDMVDPSTRMVKVRIVIRNASGKFKTGMYANVSFGLVGGEFVNVGASSLITIQGRHYVFVKVSPDEFERREIQIGQQLGDRVVVYEGVEEGEEIATEGVMQLKGLSFGY